MVKGSDDYRKSDDLNRRDDPLASRKFGDGQTFGDHGAADKSSDDIRAEICRTRADMDETVGALQQKLDPQELVHRVFDTVRENAGDVTDKIVKVVRENPIPAVLVGIGLAWLAFKQIKGPSTARGRTPLGSSNFTKGPSLEDAEYGFFEQYQEIDELEETAFYGGLPSTAPSSSREPRGVTRPVATPRPKSKNYPKYPKYPTQSSRGVAGKIQELGSQTKSTVSHAAEKIQNIGSQAMTRVHDMTDYVKDKASNLGEQVQCSARQAKDWASQTMDEYPLAVGAAFFTLGLAGGLAIPATKPENRLLGPSRDRLFNQAQEVGSELIDKGQEVAERAVGAVKQAVASGGSSRPDYRS